MNTTSQQHTTVLLMEDDPLLHKMYQTKLVSEGYDVLVAQDGEEGLTLALSKKPQCIVLDVMVPKKSGLEVLEALSKDETGKTIPVIMLTNLSREEERQKALSLGAKAYLIKAETTPKQVVEMIKKVL